MALSWALSSCTVLQCSLPHSSSSSSISISNNSSRTCCRRKLRMQQQQRRRCFHLGLCRPRHSLVAGVRHCLDPTVLPAGLGQHRLLLLWLQQLLLQLLQAIWRCQGALGVPSAWGWA
jgi:hypothetical protein